MNSKLISVAAGAALISASALATAGDFRYRGGFDDRHDRQEQRYERRDDDRGDHFGGRRNWAPIEHSPYHHWKPYWKHHHHHHDRWANHWSPPHQSYGPSYYEPSYYEPRYYEPSYYDGQNNGSITFILRGDLN